MFDLKYFLNRKNQNPNFKIFMISKAQILSTSDGGLQCKVKTFEGEILDKILILQPYGEASNPVIDKGSLVLLFYPQGSKTNAFAVPYNPSLQPSLQPSEKVVGNLAFGNKITFKKTGDVEISGDVNFLVQALLKITLNAPQVALGDAVGLVLNNQATMQVTIPSGSSAGTYPVTIINAGQIKVMA